VLVAEEDCSIASGFIFQRAEIIPAHLVREVVFPELYKLIVVGDHLFFQVFLVIPKRFDRATLGTQPEFSCAIGVYWFELLDQREQLIEQFVAALIVGCHVAIFSVSDATKPIDVVLNTWRIYPIAHFVLLLILQAQRVPRNRTLSYHQVADMQVCQNSQTTHLLAQDMSFHNRCRSNHRRARFAWDCRSDSVLL